MYEAHSNNHLYGRGNSLIRKSISPLKLEFWHPADIQLDMLEISYSPGYDNPTIIRYFYVTTTVFVHPGLQCWFLGYIHPGLQCWLLGCRKLYMYRQVSVYLHFYTAQVLYDTIYTWDINVCTESDVLLNGQINFREELT